MLAEFDLIRRYFVSPQEAQATNGVALENGDDASLLMPRVGQQLVVSVDTSVVDVHFPYDAPSFAVGHRALAVALSDLAAMGAVSRWCLMALTLNQRSFVDNDAAEQWVSDFAKGFHTQCQRHGTSLVGGDVTSGALTIGVTVMGDVPTGMAMTRSGARAGDVIAVTGVLGGGAGGLALWQKGERDISHPLLQRYLLPEPRLAAGVILRNIATAALDISDGLLADLAHLRAASNVGATLEADALPLAEGLEQLLGRAGARQSALSGGDDYELLVTLNAKNVAHAQSQLADIGVTLTVIGRCTDTLGVRGIAPAEYDGWQHFSGVTP